jgi:hypothetical protein
MKYRFLLFALVSIFSIVVSAQQRQIQTVEISLKNTSLLPKKITVIAYQPGDSGNSTTGIFLLPGFSKKFTFQVGTKVYLADSDQIDQVMGGKRIDGEKPFLVVEVDSNGRIFNI